MMMWLDWLCEDCSGSEELAVDAYDACVSRYFGSEINLTVASSKSNASKTFLVASFVLVFLLLVVLS